MILWLSTVFCVQNFFFFSHTDNRFDCVFLFFISVDVEFNIFVSPEMHRKQVYMLTKKKKNPLNGGRVHTVTDIGFASMQ